MAILGWFDNSQTSASAGAQNLTSTSKRGSEMWKIQKLTAAGVCALLIAGCAGYQSQQEQAGMIVGGLLGGVLGSQVGRGDGRTAAIILGTLAGTAIGGSVGQSMSESDARKTSHALENVRTGVPSRWRNPDSGVEYLVVPTRTYDSSSGPCREYTVDASVSGKSEKVFGTACRQADGSWQARN